MTETPRNTQPRERRDQEENATPSAAEQSQNGTLRRWAGEPAWWRYLLALAIVLALSWGWSWFAADEPVEDLAYSEFKTRVEAGDVEQVTMKGDRLTGRLVSAPDEKDEAGGDERAGASSAAEAAGASSPAETADASSRSATGTGDEAGGQTTSGAAPAERSDPAPDRTSSAASTAGSGGDGGQRFRTTLPPVEDPGLMPLLEANGVEVDARSQRSSLWMQALVGLLPWLLLIGLFWWGMHRLRQRMAGAADGDGAGGIFGFGRSKARRFERSESETSFDDVAGLENAKRDLREITEYLKQPDRFRRLGAKTPRGVLLMGPPGTGKTLLAKALAGEADVPFYSISGSEFIEMLVGVGASRVRDMFESAKAEAPSIIFIDEIDSIGRARGTGVGGGHDEREQTLNQILGEMDGFDPHEAVIVLAATNRPDVLDPALTRPGRFDRKVSLDLPDRQARRRILDIHTRDVALNDDADLDRLAKLTAGFSGADLENLVNEAALLAGRHGAARLDMSVFLDARDKLVLGARRELAIGEEEKRLIAYHEGGHALLASLLPEADPLDKVTIIPRGRALGATEQIPWEERYNLREGYLRDRIGVMLGGRAAERVVFDELSSGAEQDLEQATGLARRMVGRWGMSEAIGPVAFRRDEKHVFLGREMAQQRDFSERTAQRIDEEVGDLLRSLEQKVIDLLQEHRDTLDALAEALLEEETLDAQEIRTIIHRHTKGEPDGQRRHHVSGTAEA